MFVRDGQIKTCANQTGHNPSCGVVRCSRGNEAGREEISFPINQSFWTDSTCVLRYIENQDKRFQTFVANRIAAIHNLTSPSQWNYVNTELNPADDASRGVSVNSLERWIGGPEFLCQSKETWPRRPDEMNANIDDADPEVKRPTVCANYGSNPDLMARIINRYSSWNRLRRVVAWVLRYKANLLRQSKKRKAEQTDEIESPGSMNFISEVEIQNAEIEILKYVQEQSFREERDILSKVTESQKTPRKNAELMKKASSLYKLDPVFDDGLSRVGGRLKGAPISKDAKHPVILPKYHHVVTLIAACHYHNLSGHSGLEYTLSLIRRKYWIINGRRTVRRVLNSVLVVKNDRHLWLSRKWPISLKIERLPRRHLLMPYADLLQDVVSLRRLDQTTAAIS